MLNNLTASNNLTFNGFGKYWEEGRGKSEAWSPKREERSPKKKNLILFHNYSETGGFV